MSSFGQMAAMGQQAKRNRMQAMTDIDWFNAETARIGATKPQPSPAQPAKPQGLAAAKTPTFSTMISPQGSQGVGTASAASYGKMPAGWDNSSAPTSLPINEGQPGSGTIGRTLYSTDAAGQTTIPTREGYQTDGAGIPEVKDDGLGVGGLKEGGIIERVGNILGLRKPLEAPQQNANRVADQFGGLSGEAARSIRARPRQIEEELKRQGLKRGTAFVKDKAGKGSPVKDTVDAKLAEGEAVLNAAAAEMLGRDKIAELNSEGAAAMGLRGGAKMKDGVMHAVVGYSGSNLPDEDPYPGKTKASDQIRKTIGRRMVNPNSVPGLGPVEAQIADNVRAEKAPRVVGSYDARAGLRAGVGADPVMESAMSDSRKSMNKSSMKGYDQIMREADDVMRQSDAIYNKGRIAPKIKAALTQVGSAGKQFARGLGAVAKSPLTQVALAPTWAMGGGREEAEAGSGYDNRKLMGSTVGAYASGVNEGSRQMRDGNYLGAAGTAVTTALNTLGGFADDVVVKPMAHLGQAMVSPFTGGKNVTAEQLFAQRSGRPASGNTAESLYRAGIPATQAAQVAAPKPAEIPVMELAGAPSAYEQGMRAQVETRKGDNAAFSKFFNENGITDEMRANPAQAGLRRVNVPGSTDRIYQRGKNEFVGMGAPSRIAAETARANDPAVQKAALMKELYTLATQGNEQAGETLRQIIKADSDREVEGLRAQATVQAAGAKGSGKKGSGEDGGLKLAEQFKYAEGARGEDDQMSMLRGLDERKRGAWTELQAEFDNPKTTPERKRELEKKWAQIEQGAYTQDNLAKTDLLLGAKQAGADNTATGMATKYGLLGGVATGLGALYALRKGNLAPAKAALAGLLGGGASAAGGYMYGGGSQGVDENSDLYDIESMNLTADGKKITNGSQTIAFDSLPPQVQRLFLQKHLSQQRQ